jgi:hypothetical protein
MQIRCLAKLNIDDDARLKPIKLFCSVGFKALSPICNSSDAYYSRCIELLADGGQEEGRVNIIGATVEVVDGDLIGQTRKPQFRACGKFKFQQFFVFFMLFIFSPQNNCDRKEQNQERKKDRENREGELEDGLWI